MLRSPRVSGPRPLRFLLAVAFFNPLMSRMGLIVTVMLMYAMLMTIGAPPTLSGTDETAPAHRHALYS